MTIAQHRVHLSRCESWETSTSSLLLLELWPTDASAPHKRRTAFTQPPQPPPLPPHAFCGGIVLGSATGTSAGSRSPTVGCALPDTALGLKPQLRVPGQCRSCRRLIAAIGTCACRQSPQRWVNQSLFLLHLGLWQMWGRCCRSTKCFFLRQVHQQSLSNPQTMLYRKSVTQRAEASVIAGLNLS